MTNHSTGSGDINSIFLEVCKGNSVTLRVPTEQDVNILKVMLYRKKKNFDKKSILLELPTQVLSFNSKKNCTGWIVEVHLAEQKRQYVPTKKPKRTYEFVVEESDNG